MTFEKKSVEDIKKSYSDLSISSNDLMMKEFSDS